MQIRCISGISRTESAEAVPASTGLKGVDMHGALVMRRKLCTAMRRQARDFRKAAD